MQGQSGFVDIRLHSEISLDSITLEHISKSISFTQESAPKDFEVFGWNDDTQMMKLGEFTYDIDGTPLQTFDMTFASAPVRFVRLQVTSNQGHPDYTVLYRLRVHGTPTPVAA